MKGAAIVWTATVGFLAAGAGRPMFAQEDATSRYSSGVDASAIEYRLSDQATSTRLQRAPAETLGESPEFSGSTSSSGRLQDGYAPFPIQVDGGSLIQPPSGSGPAWADWGADDRRNPVLSGMFGYDGWRGYPDGNWSHFGLHAGVNLGTPLGEISQRTGIGLQVGGLIGIYDWAGTDYRLANQTEQTNQGLVTYGLFKNATPDSNWIAALAHDWMIANNYSVMSQDVTMFQWRAMLGYALNDVYEVGVWGAWRGRGETRTVPFFGEITWQPHNQLNAYVHQKWPQSLADTWIWFGVPERRRLSMGGTLGDYIVGVYATIPISRRTAPYTMVNYMHQSGSPGDYAAKEDSWNVFVGIEFYPRGLAASRTVRGHRWEPRLPITNNGLFLVDATTTY